MKQNTRPARSVEGARDILRLWVGEGGEGTKYWQQALLETQKPGARAAHPFSGGPANSPHSQSPLGARVARSSHSLADRLEEQRHGQSGRRGVPACGANDTSSLVALLSSAPLVSPSPSGWPCGFRAAGAVIQIGPPGESGHP